MSVSRWGQAITRVLWVDNQIWAQIQSHKRGLRTYLFRLHLASTSNLDKVLRLGNALALAMNVDTVRVSRFKGFVDVEVPLPEAQWRSIPLSMVINDSAVGSSTRLVIGYDTARKPVTVDLADANSSNVLCAGKPGSGKTYAMVSLAAQACVRLPESALQILLIDLKNDPIWKPLVNVPHMKHSYVTTLEEAERVLLWVQKEQQRRIRAGYWESRLLVIIDEVASLVMPGGKVGPIARVLGEATGIGRALGINFLMGTQQPNQATLGAFTASDIGVRIVGRVTNADYAAHATGQPQTGAECLLGKGDMLVVDHNGVRHITTLYPDRTALSYLPKKSSFSRPVLALPPPSTIPVAGMSDDVIRKIALAVRWWIQSNGNYAPSANSIQMEAKGAMTDSRLARDIALSLIGAWGDNGAMQQVVSAKVRKQKAVVMK